MSEVIGGWEDEDASTQQYTLRLYVTGASTNSLRAIANIKAICEEHLPERYNLEVVDVYQDYSMAAKEQIIALPMLVRIKPEPTRRLIGDMSDTKKVLKGLGLDR
jgi:circadian clock protein KaiB